MHQAAVLDMQGWSQQKAWGLQSKYLGVLANCLWVFCAFTFVCINVWAQFTFQKEITETICVLPTVISSIHIFAYLSSHVLCFFQAAL